MARFDHIKLVVSDLDGTLLNRESLLSEANLQAVKALKDKGIYFTFATGRMDKMTWHYAEQLEVELPIISCNGAMLRKRGESEWFYRRTLPREAVLEIQRLCDPVNADYIFYGVDTVYPVENSKRADSFRRYNKLAEQSGQPLIKIIPLDQLPDRLPSETITKAFVIFPPGESVDSDLGSALTRIEGVEAVVSMHGATDIMPLGSSKGDAVAHIANELGIPMEQVCCLGDQSNDISMLQQAGLAIGMRSGAVSIREHCDYFAEHFNCDGLGRALRQFFLQD